MDFTRLFREYSVPADLSRLKNGWIGVNCPFCGDTGFHMGFNIYHDYCSCFRCGGQTLRQTLSLVLGIPYDTLFLVLEPYQERSSLLKKLNDKKPPNRKKIELPDFPLSKAESKYLLDRHFSPKALVSKYGIRGGGYLEWKNRIIIPVYLGGNLITWTGRTVIKDREPRYKNLENHLSMINPKNIFFNLDNCHSKTVVLLEGPFDVMRFGDESVCGFGISLTRTQIMYLSDRFSRVYIIFDNQRVAQKKAREYGNLLCGHGLEVFIVDISDYGVKDIGELSPYNANLLKKELGL